MIFLIECVVACLLFTAALEILAARRREVFVNDYPPVVTDRLRGLGVVAQTPPSQPPWPCCSEKNKLHPIFRQVRYHTCTKKWGAFLCQKGYPQLPQTGDT